MSVVIPCYNHARFLPDAIASVRRQSHASVEVVVVDDGSEDDTKGVAAAHSEVRYVRQTNQGLSAARNTGMRESSGEYLVFLDADDRLLPDALEAGLRCLRANPEAAFASGHFRYINADGAFRSQFPPRAFDGDAYAALLRGNYIGMHATVIYRREPLDDVGGFDTTLHACEDYDVYLRIAQRHPVCRHGTVVAEYRQHASNMSSDTRLMLRSVLTVLDRHADHARNDPELWRAFRSGRDAWKRYYAEQQVRRLARGGRLFREPQETMRGIAALARYGPRWAAKGATEAGAPAFRRIVALVSRLAFRGRVGASVAGRWLGGAPPVGRIDFGQLRRVTPISGIFGYDRGLPLDRYYIEGFLTRHEQQVRGRVLEVGDDAYTRRFGGDRVTKRDVLHVAEGNPQATFVGDLSTADHIPSDAFDAVILTQTLHLIYEPRAALETIRRILRPGGVLLATFPGISQIDRGEWGDTWFWGFTLASAKRLFESVFPASALTFESHGDVLAAIGFLHGIAAEELLPEELDHHDPHYQVIVTVCATKPASAP